MRIALAKLLLAKPSLLLLDEPTNHLDLETRNWLEDYLRNYPFGYILISHDRYFLDVTIDRTVEIWNQRLAIYQGNYTKYLAQKDERREQLTAAYRNQRERIAHLETFINRFRYTATKAKQVQSRVKELEKIERIEIPEEEPVMHFKFPQPPPSGRMVVEAENLSKDYGAKCVFSGARFTIERGDRLALVGVNGAGKSTLIKLLTGEEAPTAGHVKLGHHVVAEYFAQDQYKILDPEARMLDDINRAAVRVPEVSCARCSAVSFSPATTFSSRWACSRAASAIAMRWRALWSRHRIFCSSTSPPTTSTCAPKMCCLTRSPATAAPSSSSPTIAISSIAWPRAFSKSKTVQSQAYKGNYEDYLRRKAVLAENPSPNPVILSDARRSTAEPKDLRLPFSAPGKETGRAPVTPSTATLLIEGGYDGPDTAAPKKKSRLNPIKQKQMQSRCAFLEEEIPRIEAAIAHTEQQLAVYVSAAETQRLVTLAEELRAQLSALTAEWEELMAQLDGQTGVV